MARSKTKSNSIIPWRFALFFGLLAAVWVLTVTVAGIALSRGLLIAFDIAAIAFLASHAPTLAYDAKRMRAAAAENDANRVVLLIVSFLLSIVILAAIVGELSQGQLSPIDKVIVAVSLILVWTFGNAVYTLHYAHLFYTSDDGGKDLAGLEFPKMREPLMADFAYFAFTLGVAVQTSDVAVTSPHIRKVVTMHCVAGFFFNLGVLALTINILGSR
ncbi:MAG TPA: DUF1345 domain-containing protein [Sphingomicrobium sp.]|nr:DUF1345 domain-containing protein [Sphingomicrobium sp.]